MFLLDGRLEIIVTRQGPGKVRRARGLILAGKETGPVVANHVGAKQDEIRKETPFTGVVMRSPSPATAHRERRTPAAAETVLEAIVR